MDYSEVEARVKKAFKTLMTQDEVLLATNASERSIIHKLAEHLQEEFSEEDLKVDCEYNREGVSTSITNCKSLPEIDNKSGRVFPDILIHERGTNRNNLLVAEAKKSDAENEKKKFDKDVIRQMKKSESGGGLGYEHGIFIQLETGEHPDYTLEEI